MTSYSIRATVGRDNTNWAGHVDSEYRETRTEFVDASSPQAAENKLAKRLANEGWRLVSVESVHRA